jgi:alpha-galactosidase
MERLPLAERSLLETPALSCRPGPLTCDALPGSYGHEQQDANTFAAWGVDYLKYDWCSGDTVYPSSQLPVVYKLMGDALSATGRPIVFSLCEYGDDQVWTWGASVDGNLWRTTSDVEDNWSTMSGIGFSQTSLYPFAAPGHWNDPDMLEIGNGGMTTDEYRTHFSLWSILAAPLLAGKDVRSMTTDTTSILLNNEVIAIDQDAAGIQGHQLSVSGTQEICIKPLSAGGVAEECSTEARNPPAFRSLWPI